MPGYSISTFDKSRIICLHQQFWSNHQISEIPNIPRSSVMRIIQLFQETGNVNRRSGGGRPRVTKQERIAI